MNFWGKNKQLPKNATSPEITEFLINHNACNAISKYIDAIQYHIAICTCVFS